MKRDSGQWATIKAEEVLSLLRSLSIIVTTLIPACETLSRDGTAWRRMSGIESSHWPEAANPSPVNLIPPRVADNSKADERK